MIFFFGFDSDGEHGPEGGVHVEDDDDENENEEEEEEEEDEIRRFDGF